MNEITIFLANPVVVLAGYLTALISSGVAIFEFLGKSRAQDELVNLKIQIENLNQENTNLKITINENNYNKNTIQQGDKSQYFQENSGPVSIDNRG